MRLLQFVSLFLFVYVCQVRCTEDVNTTNITAIAYYHCPESKFCKTDLDYYPSPGIKSCCRLCSCEADCYMTETCCPDSDIHQTNNVSITCKSMDEHFNTHRNVTNAKSTFESYYVIDTCPVGFQENDVIEGCMFPRTLKEHVFVSDPRSTFVYKNYQCAICNGVHDFELWSLKMSCSSKDSMYSARNGEETILQSCSLVSEPMTSSASIYSKWSCNPTAIDKCNVTGKWDQYDVAIVDACAKYNLPYMHETYDNISGPILSHQEFRNVYCYMCNHRARWTHWNPMCIFEYDPPVFVMELLRPFLETRLDIEAFQSIQEYQEHNEKELQCGIDEMTDPITGSCLKMFCPFGEVPVFGNCTSYMTDTNSTVTVIFEYDPMPTDSDTWRVGDIRTTLLHEALLVHISRLLSAVYCKYCHIRVYSQVVVIQAIQSKICTNDILSQIFKRMTQISQIRSDVVDEIFGISMRVTKYYSIVDAPNTPNIYDLDPVKKDDLSPCWRTVILLSPKFYCKRIQFSLLELSNNGVSNDTIAKILAKSEADAYDDGIATTYVICVDDYIGIANHGNSYVAFKNALVMLSLLIMFINK